MTQATIEIKRHHRNSYDMDTKDGVQKNLSQCELLVLLTNRLMQTIMDGCYENDDIEIIIARFGKED